MREKIHACARMFKVTSCKRVSLKSTRFSQKKIVGYFSNRPRMESSGFSGNYINTKLIEIVIKEHVNWKEFKLGIKLFTSCLIAYALHVVTPTIGRVRVRHITYPSGSKHFVSVSCLPGHSILGQYIQTRGRIFKQESR